MGYIYLITNKINGKKYVGQTQQADINDRWRHHKNKMSVGRFLLNAYNKYGIDNFKFQIICICFDSDCDKYEEFYIKKFDCLAPNGYNLMSGGHSFKHHPDSLKKMSESIKAYKKLNPQICTEETRKKLSESLKGEKHPNFNKPMSEEQKQKISESRKKLIKEGKIIPNKGRTLSEKQLEGLKIGWSIVKESKGRFAIKKVAKYDLEGNLLNTYPSISEAKRQTGICDSLISKVCKNVISYKTAGGFVWKYVDE